MHWSWFILLCSFVLTEGSHFDGGTINWAPLDPYDNSSSVGITITQSYAWSYPLITCATNVPITTSGRSTQNWNLTCVVDCSTDGGYSTQPIDMLTDCTSVSTTLGMMNSQGSHNLTLTAGAYFYLANVGSTWVALNDPPQSGLEWSIVALIDLRMQPDGFINTSPVASVVSPQYAFVNQTMQINIPVSDVNAGDDVRCRWSTYTPGFRRRKRFQDEERTAHQPTIQFYEKLTQNQESIHIRKKRSCSSCGSGCPQFCDCNCNQCDATVCANNNFYGTCGLSTGCAPVVTTTTTTTTTTASSTTAISTTTIDTPGTLMSTSSYVHRQAIDECGGICYPGSLPNGTTLSNCTITFTGLTAGTWYGVAVQVEDFINDTSTTPMSSVPVQFLIYVLPTPNCSITPIILPVNGCLEVQVGVSISFSIYAMILCDPSVAYLTDIIVSSGIIGMSVSNLASLPGNASLSYVTLTWTPQVNQVGQQQLCVIAYTSEKVQSDQSCIIFTVKNTSDLCATTTTTSTSTTSETTTTTSETRTTTSSITTLETTTTTSVTMTTISTTTSVTMTTISTTTSVTMTTTSTSTASSSTSTSTTTTSVTTTTATSTTATTATATTVTTATTSTTKSSEKSTNWLLVLGLSLLPILLALCCSCCCLYWFLWGPAARRRRRRKDDEEEEEDAGQKTYLPRKKANLIRKRRAISPLHPPRTSRKDHRTKNIPHTKNSMTSKSLPESTVGVTDVEQEHMVSSTVSVKRIKRTNIRNRNNTDKPNGTTYSDIKPANHRDWNGNSSAIRSAMLTIPSDRGNGVVVTKIPRKSIAPPSHHS